MITALLQQRLVRVGLGIGLLSFTLPAVAGFIDRFDSPSLQDGWIVGPGEEHRDDRSWALEPSGGGALTIIARDADIHGDRNEPLNYFLREVEWEDFQITTRVRFAPREPYEHAGLIVWESMDDYIKLVHLFHHSQRLEAAIEAGGRYSTQQIDNPYGDDLYLRIRKTGREYVYSFSGDGEKWTQLGSRVKAGWERPKVGLFAVSPDSGRSIPARFDFFTIDKIDPGEEPDLSLPADTAPAEPGPGQIAVAYQNPVFLGDSPDPAIVRSGDWFYVVSTQAYLFNEDVGLPLFRSPDLVNWDFLGGIFTRENLPPWVNPDNPSLWAPDLVYLENTGRYYLYFSARGSIGFGIGVGWAEHPEGPYTFSEKPLVIGPGFRNIDSQTFIDDDGTLYMYWGSHGASLIVQELAEDGLSLTGEVTEVLLPQPSPVIIDADRGPTGENEALIEAPWVVKRGDYYYLFYSGHAYYPDAYSVMVARATSPRGPFNKYGGNPILTTNRHFNAPGHNALIQDDAGQDWIVYHAYLQSHIGFGRNLLIDRIDWKDGWPVINQGRGPSHELREDGPVLALERAPVRNIAVGTTVSASSERPGHPAGHVIDGNTFTYWSPKSVGEPQWLKIDLGRACAIDRTQVLFRSARGYIRDPRRIDPGHGHIDQYYLYTVEHSLDGKNWELYADRTDPDVIAYPYIDHKSVTARYLRLTVTGYMSERPNKNIYQVKVFGSPPEVGAGKEPSASAPHR